MDPRQQCWRGFLFFLASSAKTRHTVFMKAYFLVLFLFIQNGVAAAQPNGDSQLVSQSVGTVADQVITSREVQMSIMVSRLLKDRRALEFKDEDLQPGSSLFSKAVSQVLLDQVFFNEGEGFSFSDLSGDDIKKERQTIQSLSKNVLWQKINPSAAEIDRVLMRKLKASAFFRFKAETFRGTVSDQEVRAYFDSNKSKFGSGNFDLFKDNIRMFLVQQQTQERMRAWFELIKRKHRVRNFFADTL